MVMGWIWTGMVLLALGAAVLTGQTGALTAAALEGAASAIRLALGNAATPMGIAAVRRMQQRSGSARATDEMCRLIVLNTASIQLLPTTVAAVRAANGAAAPFDILPAVWLTSVCSVTAGLLAAFLFGRASRA